jgi:soluble lytic murein transglycosylase
MRRIKIALMAAVAVAASALIWTHYHTTRYDSLISEAAARNNVDFYLVKSIVFEESWFRPEVRGSAGELGLMQVTAAAASDYASRKGFPPYDDARLTEPELNIEIGCWYLERSIDHFKNSPHPELFALLRYNAGESRADHWMKLALSRPPPAGMSDEDHYLSAVDFPKTRAYVRRILRRSRTHNFWY